MSGCFLPPHHPHLLQVRCANSPLRQYDRLSRKYHRKSYSLPQRPYLKIAVLCRSESTPWHFPDGKTFLSPPGISGNNICSTAGRTPDGAATRFSCSTHGSVVGANQYKRSCHSQQPRGCLRSFQSWSPPLLEAKPANSYP